VPVSEFGFDAAVQRAMAAAAEQAARRRHSAFTPEHLLRALVDGEDSAEILRRCGADLAELAAELDDFLELIEPARGAPRPRMDPACEALLMRAAVLARASGRPTLGVGRVLEQMLGMPDQYAGLLLSAAGPSGIDLVDLRRVVAHGRRELAPEIPAGDRLAVRLHNDDYTTMEFVVTVLTGVFGLRPPEAQTRMLDIHAGQDGALIAELPARDAVRRVALVHERAAAQQFPLRCTLEPAVA
jgi:ATP-dependent Clp protease adaptor protein ClpS